MFKKEHMIRVKLYSLIIVAIAMLCAVSVLVASVIYSGFLKDRYKALGQTVSQTASGLVNGEDFEKYLNGFNIVEFIQTNDKLRNLKNAVPDIECIQVFKFESEGMTTVFDTSSSELRGGLGNMHAYDNSWREYKKELLDGKTVENADVLVNQGNAIMYCLPVKTLSDGNNVYICTGVLQRLIEDEKAAFLGSIIKIMLFLAIIALVLISYFAETRVIRPILKLYTLSSQATRRKDTDFVQKIIDTDIKSGNELENIYRSLLKIYTSKARLASIMEKEDSKDLRMVISLVKRMDKFTATHLDNSLQYVIFLVNKMRKMDKYKDILTDEMCDAMFLAAPFHDVGKLAIPDEIVNSPRRLTDREFAIMKKHSVLGARIIDELYLSESDEPYLHLARELALSHHEKWDGSGYPNGISGEDISIPVRIISIADVFDALLSERVYKPPYSFEESLNIIIEDSGTFFDPEIVKIVIESKYELHDVYTRILKEK